MRGVPSRSNVPVLHWQGRDAGVPQEYGFLLSFHTKGNFHESSQPATATVGDSSQYVPWTHVSFAFHDAGMEWRIARSAAGWDRESGTVGRLRLINGMGWGRKGVVERAERRDRSAAPA